MMPVIGAELQPSRCEVGMVDVGVVLAGSGPVRSVRHGSKTVRVA